MTETFQEQLIIDLEQRGFGIGEIGPWTPTMTTPACGDTISLETHVSNGIIESVIWAGHGCTISMASASALAELSTGLPVQRFSALYERFMGLVVGPIASADLEAESAVDPDLHDAVAFAGVGRFPLRARCASLAWMAMAQSLERADA